MGKINYTNYNGNLIFDINGDLEYILFDEGRILHDNGTFTYEYHLKDHLGSTRVAFVPNSSGNTVVQENAYYPFGAVINELSYNAPLSTNRYKREGKEYISDFSWNKYDYTARTFDPWNGQALQLDPMAEAKFWLSPYNLFSNNPVGRIDPNGMLDDWYENKEGKVIYTEKYRSQKDLDKAKIEGKYLGITHKTEDTYYSLLNETFDLKNTDGSLSISAQVTERLDNSIISFYKTEYENTHGQGSEVIRRSPNMDVSGLKPGGTIEFDYAGGKVAYNFTTKNNRGYFDWGSGKEELLHGIFVKYGNGVNTFVRKSPEKWNILLWQFKNQSSYITIKKQVEQLLSNRKL